jgi:hypothetical protein
MLIFVIPVRGDTHRGRWETHYGGFTYFADMNQGGV